MLETQRLIIRELEQKEIPRLYELNYSPFVSEFNLFEPLSLAAFREKNKEVNPENFYLILKKATNSLVKLGFTQIIFAIKLNQSPCLIG